MCQICTYFSICSLITSESCLSFSDLQRVRIVAGDEREKESNVH
jgi:hypothetical protein